MVTSATSRKHRKSVSSAKLSHDQVSEKSINDIKPSPENDAIYRPVEPDDPEIVQLAKSIKERGLLESPVISLDNFILSGHRRYVAAQLAGMTSIKCRVVPVSRELEPDRFLRLLREFNRQREKSSAEKLREEVVCLNPDESWRLLREHREERSAVEVNGFDMGKRKERCAISQAKVPMLNAIIDVVNQRRRFWPLSDRQVHYALLNDPPLIHGSKPKSRYANDKTSYDALTELLTRARLEGKIPWYCIGDETRPVVIWDVHPDPRGFIRRECDGFLKNYYRDLQQSQPNHIEIVGEKNTVAAILQPVARDYTIKLTTARGYCSLPPRYEMAERFRKSGKEKLIPLIVSDFDPDGEEIAQSFARSMRDDFNISNVHPIKVALTKEQVTRFNLPPGLKAKEKSVHCKKFVDRYGANVYELEALAPADLQQLLREAIDSVLDIDAFNAEVDAEKQDAAFLWGVRNSVQSSLLGALGPHNLN